MTNRLTRLFLGGLLVSGFAAAEEQLASSGVYTQQQADRGEALFTTHCLSCHADKPGAAVHGSAPAVMGEDFAFRWLDGSVLELFDTIRQTMPQAAPNSLSGVEYADLTAYTLSLNGYPAGADTLDPGERERLDEIFID